jgi:hypothetical protein
MKINIKYFISEKLKVESWINIFRFEFKPSLILTVVLLCLFISCKKFVDAGLPKDQIISSTVFASDATANSAMAGIYSNAMASTKNFLTGGITEYTGLLSDELVNYSSTAFQKEFYQNSVSPGNTIDRNLWRSAYSTIYACNSMIEGLTNSTGVSATTKSQLLGEAKFVRALCYFYLINLWGDVPYINSTDYIVNAVASKSSTTLIYGYIVNDLNDAKSLLSSDYVSDNRTRPNQAAASALLARVYLYQGNWTSAKTESANVIQMSAYTLESDLNQVFVYNSQETIWQIMPVTPSINTFEGNIFILTTKPNDCALSTNIVSSFSKNDKRLTSWVDSITLSNVKYYFPYKYKVKTGSNLTEYYVVLRLAEQYLIRAEAEAHLNDFDGAINDLNIIRSRAGIDPLTVPTSLTDCLNEIEQERKVELFCEWGHRWLDLKRTNAANTVLSGIKPGWNPDNILFPIPTTDVLADPNL